MKRFIFPIILASAITSAFAGDRGDPIAEQADRCLKTSKGETIAGMTECSHQAYFAYDKQMNEVYRRVMETVDPQSKERIRESQRRWLAYREARRVADDAPWRVERGSTVSPDYRGDDYRRDPTADPGAALLCSVTLGPPKLQGSSPGFAGVSAGV